MTHIYLIRHGETDWNRDEICMGQTDIPLNELGRRQAELTAERLASEELDVIYSSDLTRAVQTAQIISRLQTRRPKIIQRRDLRELDYGAWQGHRREELEARFPEAFSRGDPHRADPLDFKPQGGESLRELRERSIRAFREILKLHRGETVAVVAHGGVIRHIVNYVLQQGAPLCRDDFLSFGFLISNCGITLIVEESEELAISFLNDTSHLSRLTG